MKKIILVSGVLLAGWVRQSVAAPTALMVYDVTEYGADGSSCSANTEGIQSVPDTTPGSCLYPPI